MPRICLLFAMAWAVMAPAGAAIVNCDGNSECNFLLTVNSWVYLSGTNGTFFDPQNPTQISRQFGDANVEEDSSADLTTGTIRTKSESLNGLNGYNQIRIGARDVFTLIGAPGLVQLTAAFRLEGTAALQAVNSGVQAGGAVVTAGLCGPGGGIACGTDSFARLANPFAGYTGPIVSNANPLQPYLNVVYTWQQQVGTPFALDYWVIAEVYRGSTVDASSTGSLSFVLPTGYSVESQGGFAGATSEVPEPSSLAMIGISAAVLAALVRWKATRA
jgi:hypothetical protein